MAIKGGDIIHVGNQLLVDRAQTAGPGNVNINIEKVYELGNYKAVGQVRDIPDLSFSVESLDVTAHFESMLMGHDDYDIVANGTQFDISRTLPLDVVSQFKPGKLASNLYDVVGSVCVPYLVVESINYKYGVTDKATQTFNMKGDSIFYAPGAGVIENHAGTNANNQAISLTNAAYPYTGDTVAGTRYALSVTIAETGTRLRPGSDYTENGTGAGDAKSVTLTVLKAVPANQTIRIVYTTSAAKQYTQDVHALASATRPAAIKGRDIEVMVGGKTITDRWSMVQNASVDYKVNLDKDMEFGNQQVVSQDFEVPDVSGQVEIKPRTFDELYQRVLEVTNVSNKQVAGALSSEPMDLVVKLHSPDTGAVLKTLYVPDARFTVPSVQGKVQSKTSVQFSWSSDTGVLYVYKGDMP